MTRALRKIAKVDKITGMPVARYCSIAEAARASGTPYNTICNQAASRRVGQGRYFWRYADELPARGPVEVPRRRAVRVRDVGTGDEYLFNSIEQAGRRLGVAASTLRSSMARQDPALGRWMAVCA